MKRFRWTLWLFAATPGTSGLDVCLGRFMTKPGDEEVFDILEDLRHGETPVGEYLAVLSDYRHHYAYDVEVSYV